jgi:hypothetical protein
MINKLMITCSDATNYVSKREEGKLSLKLRFRLFLHFLICKYCHLFARQNKLITNKVKHLHTTNSLTEFEKEQIQAKIDQNNSLK